MNKLIKNIFYSILIALFLFGRHFLKIDQQNISYYGQSLMDFIFTCAIFFTITFMLSTVFSIIDKYFQKQYEKIVITNLYISLLPLLDYIFFAFLGGIYSELPRSIRLIYPTLIFLYIPLIVLISYKYQIEKYGKKVIIIMSFISMIIIYHAVPQSFRKDLINNEFIYKNNHLPVHLIIFDGTSYEILNDAELKHLFPNINILLANDSYVFEDAHSPGVSTINSIPKLLTGVQYGTFRMENYNMYIAEAEDKDYQKLNTNNSLFQLSKSYGYNNVLIGISLPYCNLFSKYLTYGRVFSAKTRLSEALPLSFTTVFYLKYLHFKNTFISSFHEYLSKIDSSPKNTFFFVHFLPPHSPFVFDSQGFSEQYWNIMLKGGEYKFKQRYVEQLMFVDKKIGEILKKLKDNELYDESMIIVTSDHNYRFPEDSSYKDYDAMTKVPLLIKIPFQKRQYIIKEKINLIKLKNLFFEFFESQVVEEKMGVYDSPQKLYELLR